ncbi:predicted protein [Sclerotinia sclerotiorum 1980 UF-70]|uniref:Uncharacterized protein n=1 Tax=Sclerotinia sclerotiorum (strain ATCC 18683 / 1980 / Ss-1) TaxID=665079 RepID=A7F1A8_SCLS1|nr:predicted protein [Sclerotinia sclerotiorum 1980 UF-70]EDN95500.1 predicted protein [Sclerotinia sclerotiorum 1980 UF-70]
MDFIMASGARALKVYTIKVKKKKKKNKNNEK